MTKPSELDYFLSWLAFFFISTVGTLLVALVAGFCIGFVLALMSVDMSTIEMAGAIVGFLVGIPVSYICFRACVGFILVGKLQRKMEDQMHADLTRATQQPHAYVQAPVTPPAASYPAPPPVYQVPPSQ